MHNTPCQSSVLLLLGSWPWRTHTAVLRGPGRGSSGSSSEPSFTLLVPQPPEGTWQLPPAPAPASRKEASTPALPRPAAFQASLLTRQADAKRPSACCSSSVVGKHLSQCQAFPGKPQPQVNVFIFGLNTL